MPAEPNAPQWSNYEFLPSFVLGFHGCDAAVGEAILRGEEKHLRTSENDYDWLGSGIYFWEGDPRRALQFAVERSRGGRNSRGDIRDPFVLGAIINLKRCLDLSRRSAIEHVQQAHRSYLRLAEVSGQSLPTNGPTLKARNLDCVIFNWVHIVRAEENSEPYDSVRGLFWEGDEIYPTAGVREHNHIQICIRDPDCILGYFRPIEIQ